MSQMAPEAAPAAPAAPAAGGGKQGGNVFTRKIGPMPMWAWVAIISVVLIGYAYYRNKQSAAAASTTATGTDASQVPQFVNQTYTSVTPPTAGPPGPTGPAGPPGPTGGGGGVPGKGDGKGTDLAQPHKLTKAQAQKLLRMGGAVYWKSGQDYVQTKKTAGIHGAFYTGAQGWAKLHGTSVNPGGPNRPA